MYLHKDGCNELQRRHSLACDRAARHYASLLQGVTDGCGSFVHPVAHRRNSERIA